MHLIEKGPNTLPDAPQIDFFVVEDAARRRIASVFLRVGEELRRSVHQRADVLRVALQRPTEPPGHSEIAEFEHAVLVEEVAGLDIAMEIPFLVQIRDAGEELVEQCLDLAGGQVGFDGSDGLAELERLEVHHHIHFVERVADDHFLHVEDVWVVQVLQDLQLGKN